MGLGGNVASKFRDTFGVVPKTKLQWFPGHMNKGIKQMQQQLRNTDCVIEVHDARVPISGRYADFTKTLVGLKPHILVLNKVDLADKTFNKSILSQLKKEGVSNVLFTNVKDHMCKGIKQLFPLAQKVIKDSNRYNRSEERSFSVMIIGVPNVGKSSLINRLRNNYLHKPNAAQVGGVAGITRSVSTRIKISEDPPMYLVDTPGILTPRMDDAYTGLKLALVGCLQDHLVGPETLADYLLYWLNKHEKFEYVKKIGLSHPNDDIMYVLTYIAAKNRRTVRLKNYDGRTIEKPDLKFAAEQFVDIFRTGELGYYCLDEDILG